MHPRRTQEERLFRVLRRNAGCEYGKRCRFGAIRTVEQYQDTVPRVTYDQVLPWVEETRQGKPNILTSEPVLAMEKSAGSTSASKYIPYTRSLLAEFQRAIAAWMYDLYSHRKGLLGKASYWSVSPMAQEKEVTAGGIPVGLAADTEYLGRVDRSLLGQTLLVPAAVSQITDMETSRYVTLRFLLESSHLGLISVWNPSFLTILVGALRDYAAQLTEDVALGALTPPGPLPKPLKDVLERRLRPRPERGRELRRILRHKGALEPHLIWPDLQLISCWTSGASARSVPELRSLFPGVEVQGKGLLATEGVVSIPVTGLPGAAVTVTSHFYEFQEVDGPGSRPKLVDELEVGKRYAVLLTTGGGLYRYDLQDSVEVVGMLGRTPLVEFTGKTANISDLCGEKLNESWVAIVLERAFATFGVDSRFAMVAPEWGVPPFYVLFLEAVGLLQDRFVELVDFVETKLKENHHYAYCRRLGQLGPLRGFRVRENGAGDFLAGCTRLGQQPGSIKHTCLHRAPGWCARMDGMLVGASCTAGSYAEEYHDVASVHQGRVGNSGGTDRA
jgi:hypothetical protein